MRWLTAVGLGAVAGGTVWRAATGPLDGVLLLGLIATGLGFGLLVRIFDE